MRISLSLLQRFVGNLRTPMFWAVGLSLFVTFGYNKRDLAEDGIPLLAVVAAYVVGAVFLAIVLTLAEGMVTSRARAALAGLVFGMIVTVLLYYFLFSLITPMRMPLWKVLAAGVMVGVFPCSVLGAMLGPGKSS